MNYRPARLFTPVRLNERRLKYRKWVAGTLLVGIVFFAALVINKYIHTDLVGSLFTQLHPSQEVVNDTAGSIVAKVDPSYFKVYEAQPDERGDVILKSENGMSAHFSKDKDVAKQVYSLQTILVQARINAKVPKNIDLRFEKIYVEYQ